MRAFRFFNLAILSVLVGCLGLAYAQDERPQEEKPAQQEEAKPQPKQDQKDQAKPSKQEKEDQKQGQKQSNDKMTSAGSANKGGHIPDDKFRAHFGRSHTFTAKTVIVQGQPQFQYGGYSFQLVEAWPVGWAYTDQCYIDYINGEYFLFDLLHPGVQIAVFVVM
jgi:hypothetical protein